MRDDSIWKKEIHLRPKRKPKAERAVEAAPAPAAGAESVWKKEIHLWPKRKVEPLPELRRPAPAQPEPESVAVQPEPVAPMPEPERAGDPWLFGHEPEAEVAPEAVAEPAPEPWLPRYEPVPVTEVFPQPVAEPEAEVEPPPYLESFAPEPDPEPERDEDPWLFAYEPVQEPELELPEPEPAFEPEPEPEASAQPEYAAWPEPEPEHWQPAWELPPRPEPVAEVVDVEPEPVAEADPEPVVVEPEPEPVAAVEPAPDPEPTPEPVGAAEPAPAPAPLLPQPQQRWWNREISLGRDKAGAPEPVREFVIPEPKRHWWDREVSLGRGTLEPVAQTVEPEVESVEAPPEPRARRRPSLPKPSRPALPALPSIRHGRVERVVGLKIGGSQIAAACIANNGGARLEQLARMPLASGVVAGGELRDSDALAAALRTFFSEHKLPRRGVRLGVASSRIGVRSFEIAGIEDEKQFVNAVRFRAQETLPIPLEEAVLDYRVLDERVGDDGERVRRVLLVVAHRDLVDRYVEACRLAGVTLAGIDLEAFALLRALAPPADREGSALVAVSIGHERTTLAVSNGRVCEFTRVLEWGGWVLNVALARALGSTPTDVELVKRSLSLAGGPAPEGLSPEQATRAVEAVRRGIESLSRELVSSLTYYQSQPDSLGIGEVVVTGGTARLGGLAEELERLLGVPVRVGDPLARLEVAQPVDQSELGSLAIAVGLGIED